VGTDERVSGDGVVDGAMVADAMVGSMIGDAKIAKPLVAPAARLRTASVSFA